MTFPFLPHSSKWIGYIVLAPGIILGYLWSFAGFKPEWMSVPVFAVYSSYLKKVIFGMSRTNLSDELPAVLLLLGAIWLLCSRESDEGPEVVSIRYKAMIGSVLLNSGLLLFSILFVFGFGFINVMILNLFSQLFIYLILFRILLIRHRRQS
jgi:hypothetical protein